MKMYKNATDVLIDINTVESAEKYIAITNHDDEFYFSYPGEDEFIKLKGKLFITRTFIPVQVSIHQEVGSYFIYKWDSMSEVVEHFETIFNS